MVLIVSSIITYAQADTTVIRGNTIFYEDIFINKDGETKVDYYCKYNNEKYKSNKTSYTRFLLYRRFNANYVAVIITNKKSKKIIIL